MKSFYKRHKRWIDQPIHMLVFGGLSYIEPAWGPLCVAYYELCDWHFKVGPITIGQWPPGNPKECEGVDENGKVVLTEWVTQMARVEDLRHDLWFELLGCVFGTLLRGWV